MTTISSGNNEILVSAWRQILLVPLLWLPRSKIVATAPVNLPHREIQSPIKFGMLLAFAGVDLTRGPVAHYGCRDTLH